MYIPEIPENSLINEIKEIINLAIRLDGIKRFAFNYPAIDSQIIEVEKTINYTLPDEYKDFLKFSNGITLNNFTADFYTIDEIVSTYNVEKEESFPEDYIIIADIIGDGEILCFSGRSGKFVMCFGCEERIFDTFKAFLKYIIKFIKRLNEEYLLED